MKRLFFMTALMVSACAVEAENGIRTECVPGATPGSWTASTDLSITSCGPEQTVTCLADRPSQNGRVHGACCNRSLSNDGLRACVELVRSRLPDAGARD